MKLYFRPTALCAFCVVLALVACGKQTTLDFRNAQIINGKVYASNANTPFSGLVTNVPSLQVLSAQEGIAKFAGVIGINTLALIGNVQAAPGMLAHGLLLSTLSGAACDAQVKDGMLDGRTTCKSPQSESVRMTLEFRSGLLDGPMKYFDPRDTGHVVSEVTFTGGQPDGKQEIYSPNTRKLAHTVPWSKGIFQGDEEGFDEATGNRILQATLVNGKYDGRFVRYAPDGNRVIYAVNFVQGQMHGAEEAFDPLSGKLTARAEYAGGKLNGSVKQWDANGNLTSEKVFRGGEEIAAPSSGSSDLRAAPAGAIDSCVEEWTAGYRKEKGEAAMIAMDQILEWESWCRAGKRAA